MTIPVERAAAFLFHTDVYKWGHHALQPKGITEVYSNYTNRGSRIEGIDKVVHFGLTAFLNELYEEYNNFLAGDIDEIVAYYQKMYKSILGSEGSTTHIYELHKYGNETGGDFPIEFYSLPEGDEVPLKVPSFTFVNTHPSFSWLTNFIETWLSASVWQSSTVATKALSMRRMLNEFAIETTGSTDGVGFQLHDFSYRGMTSKESAGATGAAHLLAFDGSDNLEAINYINQKYPGDFDSQTGGFLMGSVLASEHSVMCAGSAVYGEFETYKRILEDNPTGIVSLVSDTYDLWNVTEGYLPELKDLIESRDGKLVIRPDSGNPIDILCGTLEPAEFKGFYKRPQGGISNYQDAFGVDAREPEQIGVIELLWNIFGGTVNELGYKVLNPKIGAIYGDSITPERAKTILERLKAKGFASTNVVFGVGSYSYQLHTRDTFGSAVKATNVVVNETSYEIFKDPVTDNGTKKSARGLLKVIKDETGEYKLLDQQPLSELQKADNWLKRVTPTTSTYSDIRDRVRNNF